MSEDISAEPGEYILSDGRQTLHHIMASTSKTAVLPGCPSVNIFAHFFQYFL